jgi:hypothetical protein
MPQEVPDMETLERFRVERIAADAADQEMEAEGALDPLHGRALVLGFDDPRQRVSDLRSDLPADRVGQQPVEAATSPIWR